MARLSIFIQLSCKSTIQGEYYFSGHALSSDIGKIHVCAVCLCVCKVCGFFLLDSLSKPLILSLNADSVPQWEDNSETF